MKKKRPGYEHFPSENQQQSRTRAQDREFKKEHFLFRLTSNAHKQITIDVSDQQARILFADPQGQEVEYTISCTRVDSRLAFTKKTGGVLRTMHFPQHQDATSRRMIRDETPKPPQKPNTDTDK